MTLTSEINDRDYLVLSSTNPVDTYNTVQLPEPVDARPQWQELFHQTSPFYYDGDARLTFTVADEYAGEFVLIRGLIEFHRSKELSFTYDRQAHSLVAVVKQTQLETLYQFLDLIYDLLKKERRFRKALRSVIEIEASHRRELQRAYAELQRD